MRITLRLILSLVGIITLVVTLFTYWQVRQARHILTQDLERRALILGESLQETVEPLLTEGRRRELARIVEKFGNREHLVGIGVYGPQGVALAVTQSLATVKPESLRTYRQAMETGEAVGDFQSIADRELYVYVLPMQTAEGGIGALALFHSASHIRRRLTELWHHGFVRLLIQALLISLATLLIIRWDVVRPIARAAEWIKKLRLGTLDESGAPLPKGLFGPLAKEVTHMARSLSAARATAEEEAKLRQAAESLWTPERLKEYVRVKLHEKPLFVISNREPYMHVKRGKQVECIVPASGLVTALEPVLRACGGTWIAQGSGDADREMVGSGDTLRVPPDEPQYTLRRVWVSKEEEQGYYYGFTNEGLWPLCHIAHTRPVFRTDDWAHYQAVNARFAEVTLEELRDTEEPCVLVQDYHFALLPRLLKAQRPDARVALFWHIPWPNPESFGICPWQRELLHGMLGADLLGFHIQYHCNNFLDTVDRTLESRIDWERFTVHRQGHTTWVKPFPISVAFPPPPLGALNVRPLLPDKATLLKDLGVRARWLGVGVDRIDYTKGIIERLRGVERFLDKHPSYQGQFTFVELGAPSRTLIQRYHDLMAEVEGEAERINWRFKAKDWIPIVFLKRHHSHHEIEPFYKAADVCLVTSLHDGMNLVAKEFIAARDDEDGVLILSRFTGASRELRDALIVNPYDIEQLAEAMRVALEMDPGERTARMRRLREVVRDHNIYRWGANLITELTQVRLQPQTRQTA